MGDFIRGGQVTMLNIRMVRQVLYYLFYIWLLSTIIFTPIYTYSRISAVEARGVLSYYVAAAKVMLGVGKGGVRVLLNSGREVVVMSKDFVASPVAIENKDRVFATIADAVILTMGIIGVLALFLSIYFIYKGKRIGMSAHIRGGSIATQEVLRRAILRDNRKAGITSYELAGIPYPANAENQHTFITGSPGAGKTVVIADLIEQIRARGDRAIIYDKTGAYIKWFYDQRQDVIMNPLDNRSASWSIFNEARSAADFDTMAEALMPTQKGTVDPFWTDAARVLFSNVCGVLYERGITDNKALLDCLLRTDLSGLARIVKGTPAQAIIDEQSPKTALSVMSVLASKVGAMKYLKDTGKQFSIRKWIMDEENSNFLFVTSRADQHASLMPLISTWLEVAINSLLSLEQSRDRKIWVILDELPSLHFLPSLQAGLAESRQFGGAFVLSLQVMPQLQAIYGHDVARATSGLCQTRIVFKSSDSDTARSGAESLGGAETEEYKEGLSYGISEARDGINTSTNRSINNLILPTQIMNMPNLTAYIRVGMDYPVAKIKIPYIARKERAARFIPAPMPKQLAPVPLADLLNNSGEEEQESFPKMPHRPLAPKVPINKPAKKKKKVTAPEDDTDPKYGAAAKNIANSNEVNLEPPIEDMANEQTAKNTKETFSQVVEVNRFNENKIEHEILLDH